MAPTKKSDEVLKAQARHEEVSRIVQATFETFYRYNPAWDCYRGSESLDPLRVEETLNSIVDRFV